MVYVVLVNYNSWRDTLVCLEALFRSDYRDFRVVVCDNGSSDGSLEQIKRWAAGELEADPLPEGLSHLGAAMLAKPLSTTCYTRGEAEGGGDPAEGSLLVLIDCRANLGFAGGNNVGLRYALARGDLAAAWLLNNDTVPEPDALGALLRRLSQTKGAGLCGSTLLHYHDPGRVQALGGGWYCRWFALAWHLGRLWRWPRQVDRDRIERRMSYPVGASILAGAEFLHEVGLLCEDYFLYFEELDWVLRSAGRYRVVYAPQSVVYHKVGGSAGTSSNPARKSAACDYWNARNRIFFTKRWYPAALPTVYLALVGTLLVRAALFRWDRVAMLLRVLSGREESTQIDRDRTGSD